MTPSSRLALALTAALLTVPAAAQDGAENGAGNGAENATENATGNATGVSAEDAAAARDLVDLARPLVVRGSYADALRSLRQARQMDPGNVAAALLMARALRDTGRSARALDVLSADAFSGDATDARIATLRAEILLDTGAADVDVAAALAAAEAADAAYLPAQRLRGRLLEESGRRDEAVAAYTKVNSLWAHSEGEDSDDDLLAVARARLGIYRSSDAFRGDANSVLARLDPIVRRSPDRVDALVELGDLYLATHQDQDAKHWYEQALRRNPHYAPAIFGVARQKAFRFDEDAARKDAERALRENSEYLPALLYIAALELGDGRYDVAKERIDAAFAVNARSAEARATRAALHYLEDRPDAFRDEVRAVLDRDPHASAAYLVLARVLEEQRRFAEALAMGERAVDVDPRDWDAHFLVGRNAMNVGQDDKAEEHLTTAAKGDIFRNTFRANFIKLFRKMQRFPVRDDDEFVVKLSLAEDEAYYPLLRSELGASLDLLRTRWDFQPTLPLYISVFDQQSDFATRTIGLPGFPALGACFGRVVTLDSPRALPPGAFSWRATLHHELAHVITLQLSKGRVPRWLTEGLSVYEERQVSPQWNREMERTLIDAIASEEVLTLADVNAAFRGSRVLYAYYQGGLMCDLIERDFGFPALREMVRLHGEGLDTPAVVRRALSIEPEEFDARFLAFAKDYVAAVKVLPRPSAAKMRRLARRLRREKGDADGWLLLAAGHVARRRASDALSALGRAGAARPGDPLASLLRGMIAQMEGRPDVAVRFATEAVEGGADYYEARRILASAALSDERFDEAKAHLRRAIELFPVVSGPSSPRLELAKLLRGEGALDEAMQLLRDHADVAEDDWGVRVELARYFRDEDDAAAELATLRELRDIVPLPHGEFDRREALDLHGRIAELCAATGATAEVELSRRLAVGVARMETGDSRDPPLDGADLADLVVLHASALRLVGRIDEARYRIDEALRLDPENGDALDLRERLPPE